MNFSLLCAVPSFWINSAAIPSMNCNSNRSTGVLLYFLTDAELKSQRRKYNSVIKSPLDLLWPLIQSLVSFFFRFFPFFLASRRYFDVKQFVGGLCPSVLPWLCDGWSHWMFRVVAELRWWRSILGGKKQGWLKFFYIFWPGPFDLHPKATIKLKTAYFAWAFGELLY